MLIRNKLTLLFTGIMLAIQLAFSGFVYTFYSVYREQGFNVRLQGKARLFGRVMVPGPAASGATGTLLNPDNLRTLTEERISIFDHRGVVLFTNQPAPYRRQEMALITRLYQKAVVDFRIGHEEGIGLVYTDRGRPHYIFVTGYDRLGYSKQQNLLLILLVANVGGFMLIIIAGWFLVGRFLSPLSGMVDGVQQISGTHLHLRLDEGNRKDEIARLAMTFNQMLTQLEATFASQRQFVSHASHELRTPLTTVLGTLETSFTYDTDPADWRSSMQVAMRELTKLVGLTNSLLNLATAGSNAVGMDVVRLDECLMRAIADVKRQRTACTISFGFGELPADDFFVVRGNEMLLTTALQNVIDNACKYSQQAVRVTLKTQADRAMHLVEVTDQGVGISPADQPHIFEPLYRGQNSGRAEGFGVGLAITQQVVSQHGGTIHLQSAPGAGTTITIELPAYGADAAIQTPVAETRPT